jgi:hypothetical protein
MNQDLQTYTSNKNGESEFSTTYCGDERLLEKVAQNWNSV